MANNVIQLKTFLASFGLMLSLGGCQKLSNLRNKLNGRASKSSSKDGQTLSTESESNSYGFVPVRRGKLVSKFEADGKLEASEKIDIRAEKRLRLGPAKLKSGDRVKRGDVLFVADTKELEQRRADNKDRVEQLKIDKKASESQLSLVSKNLDRKKLLVEKGVAAQRELDDARNEYATAEATYKTKSLDLRKAERELALANDNVVAANIIAPIAGIISSIITGGEEVGEGQSLASISNPEELVLTAEVDETAITKLANGQVVKVMADGAPDGEINGVIRRIDSSPKSQGSLLSVYGLSVSIPQDVVKKMGLRDGYSARIAKVLFEKPNVITVPKSSLRRNGKDYFVLVAASKDGVPSPRAVSVGLKTASEVEIIKGLAENELVAIDINGGGPTL